MANDEEIEESPKDSRIGNKWWLARSSHGRKPIYDDPDKFRDACFQYYEHVAVTPLWSNKPMVEDKVIRDVPVAHMRIMTIEGCARYIGMTHETWTKYKKKEGFSEVVKEAEDIIREYKLGGAASGLLNANIIARDIQLRDNVSIETEVVVMTQEDRLNKLKQFQS